MEEKAAWAYKVHDAGINGGIMYTHTRSDGDVKDKGSRMAGEGLKVDATCIVVSVCVCIYICICVRLQLRILQGYLHPSPLAQTQTKRCEIIAGSCEAKSQFLNGIHWSQRQLPGQITFGLNDQVGRNESHSIFSPKGQAAIMVICT